MYGVGNDIHNIKNDLDVLLSYPCRAVSIDVADALFDRLHHAIYTIQNRLSNHVPWWMSRSEDVQRLLSYVDSLLISVNTAPELNHGDASDMLRF